MSGNNFDKFLKLNASRGGRDKIYRVIQYSMKTNNALYEKPPPNLKRMESSLSSARHVFRLTTFIESIYGLGTAGKRILSLFINELNNKLFGINLRIKNFICVCGTSFTAYRQWD